MSHRNPDSTVYREVTRAARVGLGVNLALGLGKLAGGWASGSIALLSDAVNSLGDVFTSLVILFALRVAQRPPDAQHPYGHSRAEAIAATNVALLVMVSALAVGWEALQRITETHTVPPAWTLWIAAASAVIKEVLYRYKSDVGRRTHSQTMMAGAWDHRSDALCSLAVLVGLAAVRWGGPAMAWADEAAALAVVAVIVAMAAVVFRNSASELMDAQATNELVEPIRREALAIPGIEDVETLWVRKSGLEYFADIHIEVDPEMTVADGHRLGHAVKDRLLAKFPVLRDVLVHLEPCTTAVHAAADRK